MIALLAVMLVLNPDPGAAPDAPRPRSLAVLLFEGVEPIDFVGPHVVFDYARSWGKPAFRIYTVAERKEPLRTGGGLVLAPDHDFASAPAPDVLLVPGGAIRGPFRSEATQAWVRKAAAGAELVMSVCNGAYILAKAGLLDGIEATTTSTGAYSADLRTYAPTVKVVDDRRFVDAGRVVTTAGLSSGIDGALHVVEKLLGRGAAQDVALHIEYDWRPDSGYVRAQHADMHIAATYRFLMETGGDVVLREGDREAWTTRLRIIAPSRDVLLAGIGEHLQADDHWTRHPAGAEATRWTTERGGSRWEVEVSVDPAGQQGEWLVTLRVRKRSDSGAGGAQPPDNR